MLFMASLIIAIAMESSGFHKRIALRTLILMGNNLRVLFGGFMFTTMFLGIWIINTAATAMILPIADVVVEYLFEDGGKVAAKEEVELQMLKVDKDVDGHRTDDDGDFKEHSNKDDRRHRKQMDYIKRLLYICVAYSATIGGTTTLTSNGPNLVLRFVLDEFYSGLPPVDYATWLLYCLPSTLISISLCWMCICLFYLK